MSVMTPEMWRGRQGQPRQPMPIQAEPMPPPEMQRQAVVDQLAPSQPIASQGRGAPAAPRPAGGNTAASSPWARGGEVKQLPGFDKNQIAQMGASTAANVAGKVLGNTAGGAAAGAGIGLATGAIADKLKVKEEMPTFGGPNGQYLDEFGRRFEGTGGGIASNAVRYAGYGANPALVAATGGLSVAAGAIGGAIKGAVTKNAPSAFTDFRVEDGAAAIQAAYKNELGREASDDEVMAQLVAQGWDPKDGDRWVGEKGINAVLDSIRSSPEAQAYRTRGAVVDQLGTGGAEPVATNDVQRRSGSTQDVGTPKLAQAGAAAPGAPASGAPPATPAAPTAGAQGRSYASVQSSQGDPDEIAQIRAQMGLSAEGPAGEAPAGSAAPSGGFVSGATPFSGQPGPNQMRGLVPERAFAAGDPNSVKDAWTRAAAGVQTSIAGLSKPEVEQVIRNEMLPALEAEGVKVLDVVGDQILVETAEEGPVWKDVVYQAGAGDAAFHWEDVGGGGGGGTGVKPSAGVPNTAIPTGAGRTEDAGAGEESDTLASLRAAIERIMAGQPDRNALMAQLGGGR